MKKIITIAVVLTSSILFASCASVTTSAKKRAGFDFQCPSADVTLKTISGDTYLAQGCGKSAIYNCFFTGSNSYNCIPEAGSGRQVSIPAGQNQSLNQQALQQQMMQQQMAPKANASSPTGF